MAKVYAITCYRTDKKSGKRQEYIPNYAVWRKRDHAVLECARHLENYDGCAPVIEINCKTGVETIIGYKYENADTLIEYIVYGWSVY